MSTRLYQSLFVVLLLLSEAWNNPLYHQGERSSLLTNNDFTSRMAHPTLQDPRLPLPRPTPQNIEAIKKVAQILLMLGEQVIPSIIGENPSSGVSSAPEEISNDPVMGD